MSNSDIESIWRDISNSSTVSENYDPKRLSRPCNLMDEPKLSNWNAWSLECFLKAPRSQFLNQAYRFFLNRKPDPAGYQHYLRCLEARTMSKIEILGTLRYSEEGRKYQVNLKGLKFLYWAIKLNKKGNIAKVLGLVYVVLSLPILAQHGRIIFRDWRQVNEHAS